jgi:hypothetical protein
MMAYLVLLHFDLLVLVEREKGEPWWKKTLCVILLLLR